MPHAGAAGQTARKRKDCPHESGDRGQAQGQARRLAASCAVPHSLARGIPFSRPGLYLATYRDNRGEMT